MKRKLALLLAVVMMLSMLPMNVFARTDNTLTNTFSSLDESTLLVEYSKGANPIQTDYVTTANDVKVAVRGTYLELEAKTAIATPAAFTLTLNNAKFFFRNGNQSATASSGTLVADLNTGWAAGSGGNIISGVSTSDPSDAGYSNSLQATYNTSEGDWFYTNGTNAPYFGIYARGSANYVMGINSDEDVATVMLTSPRAISSTDKIRIPLVILTDEEDKPVTVTVADQTGNVTGGTYTISVGATGGTTAKFADVASGRDDVKLKKLVITETRTNTMGKVGAQWSFRIDAPSGYKFDTNVTEGSVVAYNMYGGVPTIAADLEISTNGRRIDVTMPSSASVKSTTLLGYIEVTGLTLKPLSDSTWGDITGLKVSDLRDSNITDFVFSAVIGTRVDYGVDLLQANEKDEVPLLYTGKYEFASPAGIFDAGIEDEYFQLLEVKLAEKSIASWWTEGRNTKLVLPEGVAVRGVEVSDVSNSKATKGDKFEYDGADGSLKVGGGTEYITFDKNEITIKDVNDGGSTKKTSISLKIWVSISTRMAGQDIMMEVTGGGMDADALPEALLVAQAVAPVTVETKVTTIAIGRNNQAVADIIITENGPGALTEDTALWVGMGDQYALSVATGNNELRFVKADVEVTEGDIDIVSTIGGSNLVIEIDAESSDPSTITISDIRINAATTLPSSEKDGYRLILGGSAIAANYWSNANANRRVEGYFGNILLDSCIMTDYLRTGANVATGSDGFDPTTPFEITTDPAKGEMYYLVDGEKFGITPDMYPKNVNGVVLLPVRLVAEAFGCEVGWDPIKGVATITLSTYPTETVQFTVGSPYYVKNGVEQLMLYDDGVTLATADIYETEGIGRLFVPMRWLGRAMGVMAGEITYDADSGSAYFNRAAE